MWQARRARETAGLGPGLRRGTMRRTAHAAASSTRAITGRPSYQASKGAVNALTRQVAIDYAPENIRCNAVVVGFIGVLIVLRPGFHELKIGHIAALGGGFAGAVTIVLLRHLGNSEKRTSLYGAGLIGPLVGGLALSLPHLVMPTAHDVIFIVSYGLLSAGGNVLMMVSGRMAPASIVAPTQYSQMLWGIGLGYGVFGDRLDGVMILGAVIIIGAGLFTFAREKVKQPRVTALHPPVHPQ